MVNAATEARTVEDLRALMARARVSKRAVARQYPCSERWVRAVLNEEVPGTPTVMRRMRKAVAAAIEEREPDGEE